MLKSQRVQALSSPSHNRDHPPHNHEETGPLFGVGRVDPEDGAHDRAEAHEADEGAEPDKGMERISNGEPSL